MANPIALLGRSSDYPHPSKEAALPQGEATQTPDASTVPEFADLVQRQTENISQDPSQQSDDAPNTPELKTASIDVEESIPQFNAELNETEALIRSASDQETPPVSEEKIGAEPDVPSTENASNNDAATVETLPDHALISRETAIDTSEATADGGDVEASIPVLDQASDHLQVAPRSELLSSTNSAAPSVTVANTLPSVEESDVKAEHTSSEPEALPLNSARPDSRASILPVTSQIRHPAETASAQPTQQELPVEESTANDLEFTTASTAGKSEKATIGTPNLVANTPVQTMPAPAFSVTTERAQTMGEPVPQEVLHPVSISRETGENSPVFEGRNAALNPARIADQIVRQIQNAGNIRAGGEVELRLDPPELGRIRISFSGFDGNLTAVITAERPEIETLMRRNSEELQKALADAGFENANLSFASDNENQQTGSDQDQANLFVSDYQGVAPDGAVTSEARALADGNLDIRL